jgi:hypothetical protein
VKSNRAVAAGVRAFPKRGTTTGAPPRLPGGDHLRIEKRHALADAADSPRIRQWQHLLETVPRLDATGGLARIAPEVAAGARPTGPDQPRTSGHRQRLGTGAKRGAHTGPNSTDRGKNGCKRHIVTDAVGIPLVVRTGPANQPDAELALGMLDAIPPCVGRRGRPGMFQGDGAYGIKAIVAEVVQGGSSRCWRRMARRGRSTAAGWARPAMSSSGRSVGSATPAD